MEVEGINFIEEVIKHMEKGKFIAIHENVYFLDRELNERRKILSDIYNRITLGISNQGEKSPLAIKDGEHIRGNKEL